MTHDKQRTDERIRVTRFPLMIFIPTLAVLIVLTTVQYKFLGEYIEIDRVPRSYVFIMIFFWLLLAGLYTFITRCQVRRKYDRPMRQLADATRKVANGDFSVYIKPIHTADRADYLDVMIEDFNKMVAELGSIETLKTDFFSNVSHEIKTPLSVIQNYVEMMQNPDLTKEQRDGYMSTALQAVKRLSELITNLLRLNKLEKQSIRPEPEPYDLCRQLCDCMLNFESVWEAKGLKVDVDIEDSAVIVADASLMELVWNNLLSNAMKFTEPGGSVFLRQTSSEDEVTVTVSDTGCGMEEETLKHIFDKFFQGDTSHSTEGNGLGLSLALRVLQLTGATISAESTPGEGSSFVVRIPAGTEEERQYG